MVFQSDRPDFVPDYIAVIKSKILDFSAELCSGEIGTDQVVHIILQAVDNRSIVLYHESQITPSIACRTNILAKKA